MPDALRAWWGENIGREYIVGKKEGGQIHVRQTVEIYKGAPGEFNCIKPNPREAYIQSHSSDALQIGTNNPQKGAKTREGPALAVGPTATLKNSRMLFPNRRGTTTNGTLARLGGQGHRIPRFLYQIPKNAPWFRIMTCFIPLNYLAKILLTFGQMQAGLALMYGISTTIKPIATVHPIHTMLGAVQISWGIFYSIACILGMCLMWGEFRKSPTAALSFIILNLMVSVTLLLTCVIWFYLSGAGLLTLVHYCEDLTIAGSPGEEDARKPAPAWAIQECIREVSIWRGWMLAWGTLYLLMFYFNLILGIWAWWTWRLVREYAVKSSSLGGSKMSWIHRQKKEDRWDSLSNEEEELDSRSQQSQMQQVETVDDSTIGCAIPILAPKHLMHSYISTDKETLLSPVSINSQDSQPDSTRDNLASFESNRPRSTITIGNTVFDVCPQKAKPIALASPLSLLSNEAECSNPPSPSLSSSQPFCFPFTPLLKDRSTPSPTRISPKRILVIPPAIYTSNFTSPPLSPPPNLPLPELPERTQLRTIDASLARMVLPTPIGSPYPPPTPQMTLLTSLIATNSDLSPPSPVPQPESKGHAHNLSVTTRPTRAALMASLASAGVIAVGGFEFPIVPSKPVRNNTKSALGSSTSLPSLSPPPVPPHDSNEVTFGKAKMVLVRSGSSGSTKSNKSGRGRVNNFPIAPVRRAASSAKAGNATKGRKPSKKGRGGGDEPQS